MLVKAFVLAWVFFVPANGRSLDEAASLDAVIGCMSDAYNSSLHLDSSLPEDDSKPILLACDYSKVYSECLAKPFDPSTGSTLYLDFFRMYFWQRGIVEEKSNLCPEGNINLDTLKDLVITSGIVENDLLEEFEGDPYTDCVGDVHKECLIETAEAFEVTHADELALFLTLFDCTGDKAKATGCDAQPMMNHMLQIIGKFKKHMFENNAILAETMM